MSIGPSDPADNIEFRVTNRNLEPRSRSRYILLWLIAIAVVLSFGVVSIVQQERISDLKTTLEQTRAELERTKADLAGCGKTP